MKAGASPLYEILLLAEQDEIPPVPGGIGILPAGQDSMQGNALLSYHSAAVVFPYTASAGVIH